MLQVAEPESRQNTSTETQMKPLWTADARHGTAVFAVCPPGFGMI